MIQLRFSLTVLLLTATACSNASMSDPPSMNQPPGINQPPGTIDPCTYQSTGEPTRWRSFALLGETASYVDPELETSGSSGEEWHEPLVLTSDMVIHLRDNGDVPEACLSVRWGGRDCLEWNPDSCSFEGWGRAGHVPSEVSYESLYSSDITKLTFGFERTDSGLQPRGQATFAGEESRLVDNHVGENAEMRGTLSFAPDTVSPEFRVSQDEFAPWSPLHVVFSEPIAASVVANTIELSIEDFDYVVPADQEFLAGVVLEPNGWWDADAVQSIDFPELEDVEGNVTSSEAQLLSIRFPNDSGTSEDFDAQACDGGSISSCAESLETEVRLTSETPFTTVSVRLWYEGQVMWFGDDYGREQFEKNYRPTIGVAPHGKQGTQVWLDEEHVRGVWHEVSISSEAPTTEMMVRVALPDNFWVGFSNVEVQDATLRVDYIKVVE